MTRGYVIYTENGKTASEVAYVSSSAYPAYYGLELLKVIQGGLPLRSLMDCTDPEEMSEVYPLSTYDELVCVKAVDSKKIREGWGVDYIYVYNTTTHTLSVRDRGTLLYKFDLTTQMDACRAVFKYDSEIAEAVGINPDTLFYSAKGVDAAVRNLASKIQNEDDLLGRLLMSPHASISPGVKYVDNFSPIGQTRYKWHYGISLLLNDGNGWGYKHAYEVELAPAPGTIKNPHLLFAYVKSPWGLLSIPSPNHGRLNKRSGEKLISEWVRDNLGGLVAYVPIFKAVYKAQDKLGKLGRSPGITCSAAETQGKLILADALSDMPSHLNSDQQVPGFPALCEIERTLRQQYSFTVSQIAEDAASKLD